MIERKGIEVVIPGYDEVLYVNYGFYPGRGAALYDRYGDPGWPAEDSEADVTWVSFKVDGKDIWEILSDEAQAALQDACTNYEEAYDEPEREND
jgi:hypothetical protein